jgi:hypothetical protein
VIVTDQKKGKKTGYMVISALDHAVQAICGSAQFVVNKSSSES